MEIGSVVVSLVVVAAYVRQTGSEGLEGRERRQILYSPALVFPYGGSVKLVVGIGIPIAMPQGRIMAFGLNMQFQYKLPDNATIFTNYFSDSKRRRRAASDERSILYGTLGHMMARSGADGKECLMRSICEAAETPLRDEGLVGELLHVLLTPDYGGGTVPDRDYLLARDAGRRGRNCSEAYFRCPWGHGMLDRISTVEPLDFDV